MCGCELDDCNCNACEVNMLLADPVYGEDQQTDVFAVISNWHV